MAILKKNQILLFQIAIVSLFMILVALQGGKKFTLDEMDFPSVAKTVSHTLRPVWYKGEVTNQQSGLFHPPLYINALALFIKGFGFSEMTVRIFGLICALISSYLLINMLRLFNYKNRWGEVLFLGLFLLNPYTIACATVPDIDTTIMPVFMLLFIYISLRFFWRQNLNNKNELIILSGIFAVNLWTKLTTPLTLPLFLLALLLICGYSVKDSAVKTLKIALIGTLTFLVTYYVYTKAVSLPISYTFTFLAQSFFKGTAGHQLLAQKVISNASNISTQIYWFTIPLTFVYLLSLLGIVIDRKTDAQTNIIRLLSAFSLAIFVFYICLIAPFGGFFKYPFPVFGLMVMTIVFYFQSDSFKTKINPYLGALVFSLSLFISTHTFRDNAFINHAVFRGFLYLGLAVLACYALMYFRKTARLTRMFFVYALLLVIGYQLGTSRVQAMSTYPTKYLYGQQGMDETISYLGLNTKKDEVIWSMKDVGFYVNDKYYENYPFFFDKKLESQLVQMLRQGKIRYYVATTGIGEDRIDYYKSIGDILNDNATRVATFGNFVIYRSNYVNTN